MKNFKKIFLAIPILAFSNISYSQEYKLKNFSAPTKELFESCSQKPKITVKFHNSPIEFSEEFSVLDLKINPSDGENQKTVSHANGLFVSKKDAYMNLEVSSSSLGEYSCSYIKDIEINLTFSYLIYIANDLKDNSCYKNEVIKHELKHYIYALSSLHQAKPFLEQKLTNLYNHFIPQEINSEEELKLYFNYITKHIMNTLQEYKDYSSKISEHKDNQLDASKEEFHKCQFEGSFHKNPDPLKNKNTSLFNHNDFSLKFFDYQSSKFLQKNPKIKKTTQNINPSIFKNNYSFKEYLIKNNINYSEYNYPHPQNFILDEHNTKKLQNTYKNVNTNSNIKSSLPVDNKPISKSENTNKNHSSAFK